MSIVWCSMLRTNQWPISSAIQVHRVLSSEHLAHSTEHTAVWLASEGKSRAWSVLWREPNSCIRFLMCAILLITSVKRIKLWFYIILYTWLSFSQKDRFTALATKLITCNLHTNCWWIMVEKFTIKHKNILTLIIAVVLQKTYTYHISGWSFSCHCS